MGYLIQQVLALLEPLGLAWGFLAVFTLIFLFRRRWLPAVATGIPMLIIFVMGSTDVPGAFMRTLERPYANVDLAALPKADAIVVLGGGAQPARFEVADLHFTPAGDRLIMGLEMARLGKAPVVVLGGAVAKFPEGDKSESQTVRKWIVDRQLTSGEIIALPVCKDTHDEATYTKKLATERGWQQVLLVTSANHMRRASATFRTAGVTVIPVPCNFMTELSHAPTELGPPGVPQVGGLSKMATYLHEQIGWYEYRRRGWIKK